MTSNVCVNAVFDSKEELKQSVLLLTSSTAKQFRVAKTTKTRYQLVCYSNKTEKGWREDEHTCQWCVTAKPFTKGNPDGKWIVSEYFSLHSCRDSESKRKRNYSAKVINGASQTVRNFIPSKQRVGSTLQLMNMARESDGIHLKESHARKIVQSKSQNSVTVHIGHYLLVKSYFAFLCEKDANGTFLLESQICSWDSSLPQFKRCYVCFSYVKEFWLRNGCTPLFVVDATFTTSGIIKHTLLFAVSYDGNNKLVHLAYAACDIEDAENWKWFIGKLIDDFPGCTCIFGDYVKGLQSDEVQSLLSNHGILFSRCVRHMQDNCKKSHPIGRNNNKLYESLTMELATARTQEEFNFPLEELGEKIGTEQKGWWLGKKHQYATHCFLEKGVRRYTKTTSNAAEQMNSVYKVPRGLPLLSMFHSMNEWNMNKFVSRKTEAISWVGDRKPLTEFASKQHVETLEHGSRRSVNLVQWIQGEVSAKVSRISVPHASMSLLIKPGERKIECGCKFMEETGMICFHAAAVMAQEEEIESDVTLWYEDRYHSEKYLHCYSVALPSLAIDKKLSVVELAPPEHRVTGGRPKVNRYVSTSENKKICKACGFEGHNQSTCPYPSTETRWENYREEAIEWAKSFTSNLFRNH